MTDYPKRGFTIVHPSILDQQLTGWIATAQFERQNHRYAIKFIDQRFARLTCECLRDDKPIAWHKLNDQARQVAHKAAEWLKAAAELKRQPSSTATAPSDR